MEDKNFDSYKIQLRKVQMVLLDILEEIDRVCRENNIEYFLESGTLLGAVRHGGFIPWDDDLDIGMTRENYERFIKIASKELGENYYCVNWYDYDDYGLSFAKVKRKHTIYVENINRNSKYQEMYVDIFPYDTFPNGPKGNIFQGLQLLLLRVLIKLKAGNIPWAGAGLKKKIKYIPAVILSKFFSSRWMINKYEKVAQKYNMSSDDWCFSQGTERYGKWIFKKKWITGIKMMKFEGKDYPVPCEYHKYLKNAYGDYMKLPPENERWDRHQILDVKFNE